MNKPMKDALLSREDINVAVVAWYNGSHVAYSQAAANCRLVGAQIANVIEVLHNEVGLAYSYVYIVWLHSWSSYCKICRKSFA